MPIITDISPQKKRTGYYNVFVDGEFAFSLSDLQLSNSHLSIGQAYSEADIIQIKNDANATKVYSRCLDYISRRQRSEWELRDYLKRKETSQEVIDQVIEKLIIENHLDDYRFAQAWVHDRDMLKPRSKKQLQAELIKKHIAKDIIVQVLRAQDESQELTNLKQIAIKKLPRYSDRIKLTVYLVGQGYNYSLVKTTLDNLMAENNELGGDADNQ